MCIYPVWTILSVLCVHLLTVDTKMVKCLTIFDTCDSACMLYTSCHECIVPPCGVRSLS